MSDANDPIVAPLDGPRPVEALEPCAAGAPRFCRTCGAPWQIHWQSCEVCAVRSPAANVPLDVRQEHRAIKSAVALYFTLLAVCAAGILASKDGNGLSVEFGVLIGLSAVTLIWCLISMRSVLPLMGRLAHPLWFAAAIGISFVTFAIALGVLGWLRYLMRLPHEKMSTAFLDAGYGWGMIVLCVCVQPAVIEEMAFRGVIFSALKKALTPFETVMVSALMFMILHLSVTRFPHTLALGVAAGLLRLRTRSLYPCMVMHFSHNFLCVVSEWATR